MNFPSYRIRRGLYARLSPPSYSTDILDFAREFSSFRRQGAATGERR